MENENAFRGRKDQPSQEEILSALGPSTAAWNHLVGWLSDQHGVAQQQWKTSGAKYGWSLSLLLKKRTIVYLSPCLNCFRVAFILGDRALAAALQSDLPPWAIKELHEATKYGEGTGIRILVKKMEDLDPIYILTGIKIANGKGVSPRLRIPRRPSAPAPAAPSHFQAEPSAPAIQNFLRQRS